MARVSKKAGRVDFSLPNILNRLTKVNPTFEFVGWVFNPTITFGCNFVQ